VTVPERAQTKISVAQFASTPTAWDTVIDVRTHEEFVDDHLPGAINLPVLDEAERHQVGYTYKQESPFPAKRMGAALILRHIADMLERDFADKPREWKPLVYCWRGGKRSGTLTHLLNEVGWKAQQLEGGYKTFRTMVLEELTHAPAVKFQVVAGPTGSGKTRLLKALTQVGAQVLDLEALANHRGSLLGDVGVQPSQKWFESQVWAALRAFDPARLVYVESESKKIGNVTVPEALMAAMRASPCLRVDTPDTVRVRLLDEEYRALLLDTPRFEARVKHLIPLRGAETISRWIAYSTAGDFDTLTLELLHQHYDPAYMRSIHTNFPDYKTAPPIHIESAKFDAFVNAARALCAN
jgi:tRNA 2-selenouridine synthase